MPRDSSGNYTLPSGNPVIPGTVIQASWANPTMEDIGAALTQSLDRFGRGGMQVPFRNVDGTAQAPGITWATEPGMGFFRATTNDMQAVVAGIPKTRWVSGGLQLRENNQWQLAASQQWVIDYLNAIDLSNYANLTQNETITGAWTFDNDVQLSNDEYLRGLNTGGNPLNLIGVTAGNAVQVGVTGSVMNLQSSSLRLNSAQLNQPNGLVQVNSSGFIPQSLLPISGLTFLGSYDASSNTNPPDGTVSGEFYVIRIGGVLNLLNPDTGIPEPTTVFPGDYILWSEADNGWAYVPSQGLTIVPATDVSYDNSGGYFVGDNVQAVLDEIGAGGGSGGFDPSDSYTITGSWAFTQQLNVDDVVLDGDATTAAGLALRNIAGTPVTTLLRAPTTNVINFGNVQFDLQIAGSADRPSYNAQTMALQSDIPSLQPYTQRAVNESIAGDWEFQQNTLFGAGIFTNILNSDGGLAFNGAALNEASGLAQLTVGGLLPANIVPFLGLSLQGTWNAATGQNPSETNPGTTYNGGDYYVIDVEGTINIRDPADGLYKPTLCEVGDFIVYVVAPEAPAVGWYKVARGGLDEIDASQVLYDPTGTPWVGGNVDLVLGNIGVQATLRGRAETISSQWNFNGLTVHTQPVRMSAQDTQYDSDGYAAGTQFRTAAGVTRWLWARQPPDNSIGLWRYDSAGGLINRPIIFKDDGTAEFAGRVAGVAASVANEFPILSQADGRYGRKASTETISAVWNFTAQPTINGVNIATVNDLNGVLRADDDATITGSWTFSNAGTLTTFQSIVNLSGGTTFFSTADHYYYNSSTSGGGNVVRFRTRDSGALGVYNRAGTEKLVGFRNPTLSRTMITPITLAQTDEGQIIRIDSTGAAITVPSLEAGTQITLIQRAAAGGSTPLTLSGVTAYVLDAGSGYAATGAITIDAGGVVHLAWESATVVNIWGSGLKRA